MHIGMSVGKYIDACVDICSGDVCGDMCVNMCLPSVATEPIELWSVLDFESPKSATYTHICTHAYAQFRVHIFTHVCAHVCVNDHIHVCTNIFARRFGQCSQVEYAAK